MNTKKKQQIYLISYTVLLRYLYTRRIICVCVGQVITNYDKNSSPTTYVIDFFTRLVDFQLLECH